VSDALPPLDANLCLIQKTFVCANEGSIPCDSRALFLTDRATVQLSLDARIRKQLPSHAGWALKLSPLEAHCRRLDRVFATVEREKQPCTGKAEQSWGGAVGVQREREVGPFSG
jgi:hypothetical protein